MDRTWIGVVAGFGAGGLVGLLVGFGYGAGFLPAAVLGLILGTNAAGVGAVVGGVADIRNAFLYPGPRSPRNQEEADYREPH